MPLNLKIVKEQWTAFCYKNVTINALSLNSINAKTIYDTLNLDENMINIVALHGQVAGYKSNEQGEIISIPRLKDKNIDYLALGHNYQIVEEKMENGVVKRHYECTVCKEILTQDVGDQYEKVSNYVTYLFEEYSPYMMWVFIATAGVWSIAMGIAIIIANKNEDKAKKMLVTVSVL